MSVSGICTGSSSANPMEDGFYEALANWAKSEKENNPEALTVEAVDKIRRCWKCSQPILELSNLGLKTLPAEVIGDLTNLEELN
ncbi:MAG: hypothetical protein KDK50_00235, partial [Chlamydiia bacterium]|nr:hypothetical protein [Chlamydiia bacterium]